MKIINGKLKSINGDVIIDSCNARVKLDLTDLSNSIFVTDDIFMLIKKYRKENLIFEVNKYKKFIITESSWSLNQYIKFNIKEYHFIQNKREFFTYCSGCVKGLLYYQDEFNFNNYHFICKRINKSDQYYWEIDSKEEIKKEELFLIFMILSTITGSKHFIRSSSKPTGEIVYYDYYSKSKRLTIYGSGKKQFELNFYDLYKITNKQLLKFVLSLYTDFTTSYDIRFQLNNGINLIDYLMNLWLASGKDKKIGNKSHKLYNFLSDIFKDEYYQNYLKKLIPNFKKMEDSYDKKLHFDFYYLRNEFCHGGLLIKDKELALRIVNNIFVLNEIIRMLIKNLNKIPLKSLKKYRTIPVTDNMEHCINYRIKLFNKRGSD